MLSASFLDRSSILFNEWTFLPVDALVDFSGSTRASTRGNLQRFIKKGNRYLNLKKQKHLSFSV